MRKFTSWEEAKKAYGWVGSEPIAKHAKSCFESAPVVGFLVPDLYAEQLAVIEAAKALPPIPIGRLPVHARVPFREFRRAVEALLAAEGE